LAQAWNKYSVEYPLRDIMQRLESPALLNQQELNHHYEASQSSLLRKALGASPSSLLRKALEVSQCNLLCELRGDSQSSHLRKAVQVNQFNSRTQPTYGELAFGSSRVPPNSTYKIALASNRLQKNLYSGGYHEVMDYGAIDALPNPGYGTAAGVQEDDILVQKMADLMQNHFGLKPKMQGPAYTPPFPEWYYRVLLPPRVKPPTEFTKFSGQDDTSTVEHIAHYLMQLGEASADEAFRVRYFPPSLMGPAFQWFTSLPPQSVGTWRELEQKFHAHYFSGSTEKKPIT
jgi:hypothetical protein